MLSLSIFILENTKLIDITNKSKFYFDQGGEVKEYKNTNLIIDSGFIGLKTGWTSNAGLTFVGYNQGNNRNIITIVNKSFVDNDKQTHFLDTKKLYEESINNFIQSTIIYNSEALYKLNNPINSKIYIANSNILKFGNKELPLTIQISSITTNKIKYSNYFDDEIITFDIKNSENSIRYNFLKSNIISKLISSD